MKKLLLVILSISTALCLSACGNKENTDQTQAPQAQAIDPVTVLTADNVYEAINFEYVPVVDGGVIVHEDNTSTVVYVSEPKGENDSIEIKITQPTDKISAEHVKAEFDESMQKRGDTIQVSNLGEGAYIAFPSIYVYDRGYIIKITAGSGSNTEQQNLLVALATKAVANFEAIVPPMAAEEN